MKSKSLVAGLVSVLLLASAGVASASGGSNIAQPDVQLSGSASSGAPASGATYSYTFQAKNSGTATAPQVQFVTVLPIELPPASFHSVTVSDGSLCTAQFVDAQVYVACSLGDMPVGNQKTITIMVSAPTTSLTYSVLATAYEYDVLTNLLADKNLGDNAKTITVTSGGTAPVNNTAVVSYSNFGATDVVPMFVGWGLTGLQATGFFDDFAEQFTPTVSGAMANIRLAIQQTATGGNGSYTVSVYTDNVAAPNTIGTLVGTFQGKSVQNGATSPLSTIAISNGPRLVAGQSYWLKVVPSSQSREVWYINPIAATGNQFYEDPYQQLYQTDAAAGGSQGAFEIKVNP